jgi:hypothetical protein
MPEKRPGSTDLQTLEEQLPGKRDIANPPLEQWHPALSGDIDIEIRSDGSWWHEGAPIQRPEIVRLFASILRREEDGDYYLVTPVEKWRLRVEAHPLIITEIDCSGAGQDATCRVTLNTGRRWTIDDEHPLFLDGAREGVAGLRLPHGLTAICSRAAWYRLVEQAEEREGRRGIYSAGRFWPLE